LISIVAPEAMLPIGSQSTVPRMIIQIFNGPEKGGRCDSQMVRLDFEIARHDVEIVHYDPENTVKGD
jgi:hypothetical protein